MITQREIAQLAFRLGMSDRVIEKDYVLTRVLMALADSEFGKLVAFKGGTALKKIYFPEYRFSEDLDFTLLTETDGRILPAHLERVLERLAKDEGFQFAVPAERIEQREGSVTAYINFVGPLQARLDSRDIKIDLTLSEKVIFPTVPRAVQSPFSDGVGKKIVAYSLEEILVEKLCAIIGRTEPRDIYDAHYLFGLDEIDFSQIPAAFADKAGFKGIEAARLNEVLETKKSTFAGLWKVRLAHQIKDLPHFDAVLRELNRAIRNHLA